MQYTNLTQTSEVIKREISAGNIAGAAIRIIHNNYTIYEDELGYADIENKKADKKGHNIPDVFNEQAYYRSGCNDIVRKRYIESVFAGIGLP